MEELKKFAETTSMKGVPRFMKAKTLPIRVLWLVSVIGLLCLSLYLCGILITQYLQYPTVVKIKDLNAFGEDYYSYPELFRLPGITVCNQNPLTAYKRYKGTTWQEYINMVKPLLGGQETTPRRFLSPRGYLEYLGPEALVSNNAEHDFVIDCAFGFVLNNIRYPCTMKLTYLPNVVYSQCYDVNLVGFEEFSIAPSILTLTMYLDDVNAPMIQTGVDGRGTRGVAVAIHGQEELPYFDNAGFAGAGQLTTFTVTKSLYHRLEDSANPCWHANKPTNIQSLSGGRFNYSQMGCTMAKFQEAILEGCGCISSDLFALPLNHSVRGMHFCGAANVNATRVESEIFCVQGLYGDDLLWEDIFASCRAPCKETIHSVSVSSSPWPAETAQLSFYHDFIKQKSFAKYFDAYETISNDYIRTSDEKKAVEELEKLSLIRNNFAKIEVMLPSVRGDLYSVSYQMTLASLAASIGGNLNLWSGISAIIVIEVLDLLVRLLISAGKHPTSTKITSFK